MLKYFNLAEEHLAQHYYIPSFLEFQVNIHMYMCSG